MKTKKLYDLNLQYFAEGGESEQPQDQSQQPTEPTDVQPQQQQSKDQPQEKMFTQEELNEMIAKRLERERKKISEKYGDYDTLKSQLEELKKVEEERKRAEMSELEKLQADLAAKEKAEQTLSQQLAELQSAVKEEKIRNAFITKAQEAGIAYIDDAYQLASKLLSDVNVDDDGVHGIDDVIQTLVKDKPFLLAQQKKPQKPIGEPSNGSSSNDDVKSLESQLEEAKKKKDFMKVVELSNKIKQFLK